MEENYEAAIDEAKRIIKGKVEAEDERDSQPERATQLTSQRKSLQDQARGILNHIKEELEKEKVTASRSSLAAQHNALQEAKDRRQKAKELTRELLTIKTQDRPVLEQNEHRKCVEFDKRQLELLTLIAGIEDSLAPQQGVGGAG